MTPSIRRTEDPSAPLPDRIRAEPLGTLNHELRTPLTTLFAHAELLQDLELPERAELSVDAIIRAGERLLSLTESLSRIMEFERTPDNDVAASRTKLQLITE